MVRRLVLVIHQGYGLHSERSRCRELCIRVMAQGQIKITIARPLAQGPGPPDQVTCLAGDRSAAVTANNARHHARIQRQFNRLGKITGGDLDLMPARGKLRNQRTKELHVGGVG